MMNCRFFGIWDELSRDELPLYGSIDMEKKLVNRFFSNADVIVSFIHLLSYKAMRKIYMKVF